LLPVDCYSCSQSTRSATLPNFGFLNYNTIVTFERLLYKIYSIKPMIVKLIKKSKFPKKILCRLLRFRANYTVAELEKYLDKKDRILDIGAGTCNIEEVFREKKFNVTPVDIRNSSFVEGVNPIIYDGGRIPFDDDNFDAALIITVLHHARQNEKIVMEAQRVARKIIIIEDIYSGAIHKYLTFFMDSLVNLEFFGHPHTNRSDKEWKKLFEKIGLKLKDAQYRKSMFPFVRHATYYLEK